MKASEWIEKRTLELMKEKLRTAPDPDGSATLPLEAKLQAMCELWDKLPPRFGAPHGPIWLPTQTPPPPGAARLGSRAAPGASQNVDGGPTQPGTPNAIASNLLLVGPNAGPPAAE